MQTTDPLYPLYRKFQVLLDGQGTSMAGYTPERLIAEFRRIAEAIPYCRARFIIWQNDPKQPGAMRLSDMLPAPAMLHRMLGRAWQWDEIEGLAALGWNVTVHREGEATNLLAERLAARNGGGPALA